MRILRWADDPAEMHHDVDTLEQGDQIATHEIYEMHLECRNAPRGFAGIDPHDALNVAACLQQWQ